MRAAQASVMPDEDKPPSAPRACTWEYRLPGCLRVLLVFSALLVLAVFALWLVGTAIFHGHRN